MRTARCFGCWADALAAVQLVVYAGGTLILIVFGVMLTSKSPFSHFEPKLGEVVLAGICLGPYALGWIHPSDTLQSVAELGAIFVLFSAGLETSPKDLIHVGNKALQVAVAGVIVPFVLGFAYMKFRGDATREAVFVGAAMVATSVGITARVLSDLRVLATSGYSEVEAVSRFGAEIDGFIQKPYKAATLAEKVHKILARPLASP